MENRTIKMRLAKLREGMKEAGIDYYLIPTADYHNSEYVSDFFKVREYYSGFTGSNGNLLVWQEGAGLWTDGRYFVQAQKELEGTGVTLFRMLDEGVPTLEEFLAKEMQDNRTLGFDGKVISNGLGLQLEKCLQEKKIHLLFEQDLAGKLWEQRPPLPAGGIRILSKDLVGLDYEEKLEQVRLAMKKEGADAFFLSKLDDLMWFFNIRGCDVECNPVALSYAYITTGETILFLQERSLSQPLKDYFSEKQIIVKEYAQAEQYLKEMAAGQKVLVDKRYCSYAFYKILEQKQEILWKKNPTELLKAVKNPVEQAHMRDIYVKDSLAVTHFIYWLKTHIGKECITEITAADYLEQLRREIPEFLDLSFPTISAYKANAAMMHYEATEQNHAVLEPSGMLLVDSGGQYLGGTTDITRTIVLGEISEEIKKHYTLVVAGMLQLSHAKWLHGCTGRNLDILARQPLWDIAMDYQCGTGHGVGYILNVHEGPQSLRWRFTEGMAEAVLEEGMDVTNEPGVYVPDSHGIRIENVMLVQKSEKNVYGQFLCFETLTYAPIDLEAIEVQYLNEQQRSYLNEYHQKVYEKLAPLLSADEREWLREVTRKV